MSEAYVPPSLFEGSSQQLISFDSFPDDVLLQFTFIYPPLSLLYITRIFSQLEIKELASIRLVNTHFHTLCKTDQFAYFSLQLILPLFLCWRVWEHAAKSLIELANGEWYQVKRYHFADPAPPSFEICRYHFSHSLFFLLPIQSIFASSSSIHRVLSDTYSWICAEGKES